MWQIKISNAVCGLQIKWTKSPEEWFKHNSDESSLVNPMRTEGRGLARDTQGRSVISYSRAVIGTSLMAEICIMGTTATEGEDTVTLVGKLQIQQ